MKNLSLFLLVILTASFFNAAYANHIVGGEFELVHIDGYNYELRLIQYRDAIQQENTVTDPSVLVRIFQKSDNRVMGDFILNFTEESALNYNNPLCTDDVIKTTKQVYSANIYLNPEIFAHEEGYYVAWERCCRNNSIDNIQLPNPNTVGMTFYLEFPAVEKNEVSFQNSSPTEFKPLNDYGCVGVPYTADFSGEDEDGDSLVYSLATPLDSSTDDALPAITTAPYPLVPWESGFGLESMISGNPPLRINKQGVLTVTPAQIGLFVFSVKIEEYREKVKIGEVRRDFQLLVVDCPRQSEAPKLDLAYKNSGDSYPDSELIVLKNNLSDGDRCVEIFVTDKESTDISTLRALPKNLASNQGEFYSVSPGILNASKDTVRFEVCFSACPALAVPYEIDFIASDNACPVPLYDTLSAKILVEPPFNQEVYFSQNTDLEQLVHAGNVFELPIQLIDEDGDFIDFKLVGVDFDTTGFNIKLNETVSTAGSFETLFSWDLKCEYFNFEEVNSFSFQFIADDQNPCNLGAPDTLRLKLIVEDLFADFENFLMPNAFTPNGDDKNHYFQMCNDGFCDVPYTLPPDNCQGVFLSIEIFNRWGKRVFESSSREFKWDGGDQAAGVYFYSLKFSHRDFKGQVTIIK